MTEVLRQSLVNRKQIAFHRLFKVRCSKTGRATVFSIPRMCKLMRHQIRKIDQFEFVEECFLSNTVFARLMMLETFTTTMIAEGEKKLVTPIVMCTEQCRRFTHKSVNTFRR